MLLRGLTLLLFMLALALSAPALADEEDEEMSEGFYLETALNVPFAEAKQKVTDALAAQGFAVLTEIDFQAKVKEKLNKDIPPYTILGACGAGFAHRAWEINDHVGVMLPCTVVLEYEDEDVTEVLFRDPRGLAQFDPDLAPIGEEVYDKLVAVIAALGGELEAEDDEDEHEGHDHEGHDHDHAGHSH
jgi:uncharacterized protein (DUF302 family)